MQISVVMLIFLLLSDKILGGQISLRGVANCLGVEGIAEKFLKPDNADIRKALAKYIFNAFTLRKSFWRAILYPGITKVTS